MESPNNEGDKGPTRLLLPPNEIFSAKNELYLIELLAKWSPMKTPKQLGLLPRLLTSYPSQTDSTALLLKTIPTKLIEHGEVKLMVT